MILPVLTLSATKKFLRDIWPVKGRTDVRKIWSPDLLNKIEREYVLRFGSIEATYQVFFCEALKCE